jgi:hypothetical protein
VDTAADADLGATPDETSRSYPGDELVPKPDGGATMATFLPAPPERVWPWLVQMGGDRGGWYSCDWLDNKGKSSADRVVPEWENLEIGRRLKGPTNWWTVVALPACQLSTGSSPCTSLSANSSIMLRSYNSIVSILSPIDACNALTAPSEGVRRGHVNGVGVAQSHGLHVLTELGMTQRRSWCTSPDLAAA